MPSAQEEWTSLPIVARRALISTVIPEVSTEPLRFSSANWEKVPQWLQEALGPVLVPDTDNTDRSVHAGWSGGKPVYRASMSGHCMKELYLWRTGAGEGLDPSLSTRDAYRDKGLLAANEGNLHEDFMVAALREEGFEVQKAGDEQDELEIRYKRFVVRSHPDGLIRGLEIGPQWRVLECKALNQDRFEMWKSQGWAEFRNYAFQLSLEMYLATKKYETPVLALFVVKNRNTGETIRALIDRPPVDPASIINRFSAIEDLVEKEGDAPSCDKNAEWFWCPFLGKGACDAVKNRDGEVTILQDDSFGELLDRYDEIRERAKSVAAEQEGMKALIRERLVTGPALYVVGGKAPHHVKLNERTRVGFNSNKAKEFIVNKGGDLSDFNTETHYTELRVTGGKSDRPDSFEGD